MAHEDPKRAFARRAAITAVVACLVGMMVPAQATWQENAAASGSVTAAQLSLVAEGSESIGGTITQSEPQRTTLLTLRNSTVTSSTQRPEVTVSFFGENKPQVLPFRLLRTVWRVNDASQCNDEADPGNASSMFWGIPYTTESVALGASETLSLCVRTSLVEGHEIDTSTGGRQFDPVVTATMGIKTFTLDTTPAAGTIQSRGFFPIGAPTAGYYYRLRPNADLGSCFDVAGNGTVAGTAVGYYVCHVNTSSSLYFNQHFEFRVRNQAGSSQYVLVPRSSPSLALTTSGSPGTGMTLQPVQNAAPNQLWQPQMTGDFDYQLVNLATKRCLTAGAGGGLFLENCLGLPSQLFDATDRVAL